jgi:asparagine synthase (glutamine-hydrolysing)
MCGIAGIINWNGTENLKEIVGKMTNAIAHRGPDSEGIYTEQTLGLGHRRLSIIDTSAAGNQPFFSPQKDVVIVFNGEIYNYLELREELASNYDFSTQTDTEVILAAYRKWGIQCIEKFIGMFAFALFDKNSNETYLVRDRVGVKPIYISNTPKGFVFASEIRAVLASGLVMRKLSQSALADYLRYQTVHAPNTIIDKVKMLMPGHYVHFKENSIEFKEYWNMKNFLTESNDSKSRDEVKKDVYDLLHSSIEMRMRADVPFGAFLSGGIDSSIVVGLMSRISAHPVKTFSITFHEKEFDESPYSDMIAKRFKTEHSEIRLSANDFLSTIPEALNAMDHPGGDGPNTYVVSKVTREAGVKMALSGIGGDELFAGYDIFKRMHSLNEKKWLSKTPRALRALGANALLALKPSVASQKISEFLKQEEFNEWSAYAISRQVWLDSGIKQLLRNESTEPNAVSTIIADLANIDAPILSKVTVAEISTYMQNVLLRDSDQMSMAHALEIREPFVDHRLIEYALGISDQIKFPHSPKQLLVESMGDLIPREIVDRPKMGFTFPWPHWMRGELKLYCEEGLTELKKTNAFNNDYLMNMWTDFLAAKPTVTWARIWPLVVLGHWIKTNEINA